LGAVNIDPGSTGTVVQVRTATDPTSAALADTTEISAPTPLTPGRNTIPIRHNQPVSHVLIWVSTLGSTDGKSHTDISGITLQPTAPPAEQR
jgi:putative peptidoglycan lipid II flippase